MKKITVISIILITALLASCNLDSNQGVMQMAFNATHKTSYTIIDVYGAYDNGTKALRGVDLRIDDGEFVYDDAAGTLSLGSTTYYLPTAGSGGRYREIFDNEQFDDAGNVVSYDLHRYDDEYLHREFEYAAFEVPKDAPLFNDLPTQYSISGNSEFELSDFTDALYVSFSFWTSDTSLDDFHFYITRGEG